MEVVENPVAVMKRYEMKYIVNEEQEAFLREKMADHVKIDAFGKTSIASLYYDTPECRLVSRSLEQQDFKEKIRLRSYGIATDDSPVFLELKRKAYGIVYKRRVQSTIPQVKNFFDGKGGICEGGQINQEILYFRTLYGNLAPACMIIYDRTAFYEPGGDLRLTIDNNPRYRTKDLDLRISMEGIPLLPEGYSIFEVKVQQAMPLWLTGILSEGKIYKSTFSKYGEAYKNQMKKIYYGGTYHV